MREGPQFVEDHAPSHNTRAANEVRAELSIFRLNHPTRSPDLNPIENMWAMTKLAVGKIGLALPPSMHSGVL